MLCSSSSVLIVMRSSLLLQVKLYVSTFNYFSFYLYCRILSEDDASKNEAR